MTLWDLVPQEVYSALGFLSSSAKFTFVVQAGQDRQQTMKLLLSQKIPIKTWGWRLGWITLDTLDGGTVTAPTWTFLAKKTQAYWAHQVLVENLYDIISAPRAANKPRKSGGLYKEPPQKKKKKKSKWRL